MDTYFLNLSALLCMNHISAKRQLGGLFRVSLDDNIFSISGMVFSTTSIISPQTPPPEKKHAIKVSQIALFQFILHLKLRTSNAPAK